MTEAQWLLLISLIIYVCLAAAGIKFPRTREDWSRDRKESVQILMSTVVFIMLFLALWYVSATVDWPDAVTVIFWSGVLTLLALAVIGLFAPRGVRLRFEKKKADVPEEE